MEIINEQGKPVKSGLYTTKQLFIATVIGGPSMAGFIISGNLWAREKKLLAIIPLIPGLILGFIIVLSIDSIAHFWGSNYPGFLPSRIIRHIVAFSIYFLFLLLSALLIRYILRRSIPENRQISPRARQSFHIQKIAGTLNTPLF